MNFSPVMVRIDSLKINAVDHASVINMGTCMHIDQFVAYKRNQGLGESNGDASPVIVPISEVLDNDISDSPMIKNSIV